MNILIQRSFSYDLSILTYSKINIISPTTKMMNSIFFPKNKYSLKRSDVKNKKLNFFFKEKDI